MLFGTRSFSRRLLYFRARIRRPDVALLALQASAKIRECTCAVGLLRQLRPQSCTPQPRMLSCMGSVEHRACRALARDHGWDAPSAGLIRRPAHSSPCAARYRSLVAMSQSCRCLGAQVGVRPSASGILRFAIARFSAACELPATCRCRANPRPFVSSLGSSRSGEASCSAASIFSEVSAGAPEDCASGCGAGRWRRADAGAAA